MKRRRYQQAVRPIRATSMWRVDQVFVTRKGTRFEITASLVNDDGGLRNLPFLAPTDDPVKAVRLAGEYVAGKGNVYSAAQARLRWTREQLHTEQDNLLRDEDLEDEFFDAFEAVRLAVLDRMS